MQEHMINQIIPLPKQIVGIVIPVHNRYKYLKEFYDSLKASDLTKLNHMIIVDDASSEQETINFMQEFNSFATDTLKVHIYRNEVNLKIYGVLNKYLDGLLNLGCTVMGNIDSDSIMNKDWLNALLSLNDKFPGNIYSAFNTLTKNRHKILKTEKEHYIKNSIGGINMMYSNAIYVEVVRPSFSDKSQWDISCCEIARKHKKQMIVTNPSRIQHIGIDSMMGHHDEPDTASDFKNDI